MKAVAAVSISFFKLGWFLLSSLIYAVVWIAANILRIAFRFLQSILVAIAFALLGAAYFNAGSPEGKQRIGNLMQRVVGETPKSDRQARTQHMIDRVRANGRNRRTRVYDTAIGR